jgi:hypothetical protein
VITRAEIGQTYPFAPPRYPGSSVGPAIPRTGSEHCPQRSAELSAERALKDAVAKLPSDQP